MRAETSKSTLSIESYIGSKISLVSKSEIRYEGVIYGLDLNERSISLKNVRSFGTEGRRKNGPQLDPRDELPDCLHFLGTQIRTLEVLSPVPMALAKEFATSQDSKSAASKRFWSANSSFGTSHSFCSQQAFKYVMSQISTPSCQPIASTVSLGLLPPPPSRDLLGFPRPPESHMLPQPSLKLKRAASNAGQKQQRTGV